MRSPVVTPVSLAAIAYGLAGTTDLPWMLSQPRPRYSSEGVPNWPERRSYIAARKAARRARRAAR